MSVPLWAFGLVLAASAPLLVRFIAEALDARARKRTEDLIDKRAR